MRRLKHLIVDDFLSAEDHQDLLAVAINGEAQFAPSEVRVGRDGYVDPDQRRSLIFAGALGELRKRFRTAIDLRKEDLFAGTGTTPFEVSNYEIELAAHRDGCFFSAHLDTMTDRSREGITSDRLISAVYYFHRQPKAFSGGGLAIYPFGQGEPELIEPVDNRLVVFPSITVHEVLPVSCPENQFSNARFSINCWLRRARVQ